MTIFGQSAGGESVKQLLASPPSPQPFHAAILQSQNALIIGNGLTNYKQVLAQFNCKDIACLRKVDAKSIQSYIETNSLVFPPVDGDGTSVADVRDSILTKKFANVPTFFGTNLNEARIFIAVLGLENGTTLVDTVLDFIGITDPLIKKSLIAVYAAQGLDDVVTLADRYATPLQVKCSG